MNKEAMKLVLDSLVYASSYCDTYDAITVMREALAEQPAQQEPVGTYGEIFESMRSLLQSGRQADQQIYAAMKNKPLYTSPPAQPAPVQEPVACSESINKALMDAAPLLYQSGYKAESAACNAALLTLMAAQPAQPAQPAAQEPVGEKEISAWAERHDIQGTPTDLRSMFEDATSFTTPPAAPTVQEPVAWYDREMDSAYTESEIGDGNTDGLEPLYTTPPAQPAPVQEPVWIRPDELQKAQKAPFLCRVGPNKRDDFVPLYTTPPAAQRQWVGLTDEERDDVLDIYITAEGRARAIEAKLKERNT